jgi:hypothetical protein
MRYKSTRITGKWEYMYTQQFPLGLRVRAAQGFLFEGHVIRAGEIGTVTHNGGDSVTIYLHRPHPGLDENSLFAAWGVGDSFRAYLTPAICSTLGELRAIS